MAGASDARMTKLATTPNRAGSMGFLEAAPDQTTFSRAHSTHSKVTAGTSLGAKLKGSPMHIG
jgi:hypothetical protein